MSHTLQLCLEIVCPVVFVILMPLLYLIIVKSIKGTKDILPTESEKLAKLQQKNAIQKSKIDKKIAELNKKQAEKIANLQKTISPSSPR